MHPEHTLRRGSIVAGSVLLAQVAQAALPPRVYQQARETAPFHVQVEITKVSLPAKTPGACSVSGKVVRVFRDTPRKLSHGMPIAFPVSCTRAGDPVLVGGTIWQDADKLSDARYIEVYLDATDTAYTVPLDQSRIIPAISEAPQFPVQ